MTRAVPNPCPLQIASATKHPVSVVIVDHSEFCLDSIAETAHGNEQWFPETDLPYTSVQEPPASMGNVRTLENELFSHVDVVATSFVNGLPRPPSSDLRLVSYEKGKITLRCRTPDLIPSLRLFLPAVPVLD